MEDERRCPAANGLKLLVSPVKGASPISGPRIQAETRNFDVNENTGEFFLFANDLEDRYSNNLGLLRSE